MASGQLWGGRFSEGLNDFLFGFNQSLSVDHALLSCDLRASSAYAEAIRDVGVITSDECAKIQNALETMLKEQSTGRLSLPENMEDVHSWIETFVIEKCGDVGRKLHTGRSRNDQVATAMRLWCAEASLELQNELRFAIEAALDLAQKNTDVIMPGYTHLQRAQPILFSHWLMAHAEGLKRDFERLTALIPRILVLPLGSGAIAGNSFPIDREVLAKKLGFKSVSTNSMDGVSDRDFAIELAFSCSLIMQHLSRFCEDCILYCSQEFGFLKMDDAVATGSSLMPQKKNPDIPELVRGKTARVYGHVMSLLTLMKALPLAYNKDMQEDKQAVFDAVLTTRQSLHAMGLFLQHLTVNSEVTRKAAALGYLNATDLANYLVKKGVAFRSAHDLVGQLVQLAQSRDLELGELSLNEMKKICPQIEDDVKEVLKLESCLREKKSSGSTNPDEVKKRLAAWRDWLNAVK